MSPISFLKWFPVTPRWVFHLMMLISLILLVLNMASSTSAATHSIFLVKQQYVSANASQGSILADIATQTSQLEVQAGYMGVCATTNGTQSCGTNIRAFSGDPLQLLDVANTLQSEFVHVQVLIVTICLVGLALAISFPMSLPCFPNILVLSQISTVATSLSFLIWIVGMTIQHVACKAAVSILNEVTGDDQIAAFGKVADSIGWAAVALLGGASVGLFFMMRMESHRMVKKEVV